MSVWSSKSPRETLEEAIATINLVDEALEASGLLKDSNAYHWVVTLISELRREHKGLTEALEFHSAQKDRFDQGVLGPVLSVIGTIPSWVKIRANLINMMGMLKTLEKRASAHKRLAEAIEELRQAAKPTRVSLSAYAEFCRSEGQATSYAVEGSRDNMPALTAVQVTTNTRYHTLQGPNASLPPPTGESYLQNPRPTARTFHERDRSHLSDLGSQYLETVEEAPNPTHRRSTDIPPPEPEPPYIPPNALPPPPRRQAYADSSLSQGVESPLPEREPAVQSGHTRGLSDLSAFNNANRSTSTFSSQGYAGSLSPGYGSSGSDLPRQIHVEGSIGGDSWGSSEQLEGTQIIGHTAGDQSETNSFEVPSRVPQNSESSGTQGGKWAA